MFGPIPHSGVEGVLFNKSSKKWIIRIKTDNVWEYVGTKETLEEALLLREQQIKERKERCH